MSIKNHADVPFVAGDVNHNTNGVMVQPCMLPPDSVALISRAGALITAANFTQTNSNVSDLYVRKLISLTNLFNKSITNSLTTY
jgi:hypothetical protein